jgi:lipid-A-disaccharide synthase
MGKAPKVMIVAGEASGDLHASKLIHDLKQRRPEVEVYGIGGAGLQSEGVRLIRNISELSTYGFFEVFKHLPRLAGVFIEALRSVSKENPDVVVLVDYPDFNIKLARGIRWFYGKKPLILYYIAPQVWIWRRWRARTLAKLVDRLVVLFPFEKKYFENIGAQVHFVGHPLLDVNGAENKISSATILTEKVEERKIALLPGSRPGELSINMPVMMEAARILKESGGKYSFFIIKAPSFDYSDFAPYLDNKSLDVGVVEGSTRYLLKKADFAIVAMGTATLEAALAGTPAVLIGRISPFSYIVGVHFLRADYDYYSLVNFILGRPAFPELIQDDMTGAGIAEAVNNIASSERAMSALKDAAREMREKLEVESEKGIEGNTSYQRAAFILDKMITETR